jgi:hypothetical protein
VAGDLIAVRFEIDLRTVSRSVPAGIPLDGKKAGRSFGLSIMASACKNDGLQSPVTSTK